jgi:hypothetical protein
MITLHLPETAASVSMPAMLRSKPNVVLFRRTDSNNHCPASRVTDGNLCAMRPVFCYLPGHAIGEKNHIDDVWAAIDTRKNTLWCDYLL